MNKAILILAIFAICLTPNALSANIRGTEDKDRELTQIASNINLGNLGTLIGDLIGAIKNSTSSSSNSSNSTTVANNTSNNNSSSSTNSTANNTSSSNNNSSASTNTTVNSTQPITNNTLPSDSNSTTNSTNTTNTTTTTPIKYAKNDVNMSTFQEDCMTVHNQERVAVGLANLTWSESLAASAQAWAENMAVNGFRHSGKTGENIASTSYSTKTLSRLLGLWTKEQTHYIPGCTYGHCSTNSEEVGHYTQMVWHSTTQVGCGFAPGANRGYNYLCCQYYKAGNIIGQQVYPYPIPTTSN